MCFEMEAQSLGGDIGPECLQSDDSYSLDAFGDIYVTECVQAVTVVAL